LIAAPAAGSVFMGWGGACVGQGNPCTVVLNGDATASADFALVHRLDVSRTGAGGGAVASTPAGIDCGGDCTETYLAGTSVTLTAAAAADSVFTGWGGACVGQGNPCTIALSSDFTVSADFALIHRLDVSRTGAGGGAVASSPAGIDCGTDCTETYLAGTSVTLTATPAAGSVFMGWGSACAGQGNPCTVVLNGDVAVSADFARLYRLDVARTGAGGGSVSSTPAGIDCGADCTETYLAGTSVTLTATPAAGSAFTGWGGACSGQGNTCTVAMSGDQGVTAEFTPLFVLSVGRTGAGAGSIGSSPAGIACGADCSETYLAGTSVTLTATPNAGSVFVSWDGACAGQASTCVVAMAGPRSANARFEPAVTLTVSLVGQGGGSVTSQPPGIACGVDCSQVYARNTVVLLTATPDPDSRFVRWEGACGGTAPTCTLTLNGNKSVKARFR
jgi:NOL1/NOP2/fmu family ribosome biogenesis protein